MTSTSTTAVSNKLARAAATNGVEKAKTAPTIRDLIEGQKAEIARALPKHMDADRLTRIALTVIRTTPKLASCSTESLLGAVMTSAQLGLEPGPLGHAYLVPYGNEVTFIVGYRGLIELARRSGNIESLVAREVYDGDTFEVEYGLEDRLVHKPLILGDRGRVVAYYAVAKYRGGGHTFLVMSRDDIEKHRAKSASKNSGPWRDHYDEMAKKTCVRALAKYLPLSAEVARAIVQDETIHRGIVSDEDLDEEPTYIEGEVIDTPDDDLEIDGELVDAPPPDDPPWGPDEEPFG